MKLENVKEISKKVMDSKIKGILGNESTSKSGKMRELFNLGLDVKEIAGLMGVRYNFVYNVVSNLVIVEGLSVVSNKKESKKDKVIELFNQGKSNKEIAVELKTNYNYVYKIVKEYKDSNKELVVVENK